MAATLFRSSALRSAVRSAPSTRAAAIGNTTFTRGKATLPDLSCTFAPTRSQIEDFFFS